MTVAEECGNEAVAAFQKAVGSALAIGKGIGGIPGDVAAFEAAAKDYVLAQAAFTLACWSALGDPVELYRFADGFGSGGASPTTD